MDTIWVLGGAGRAGQAIARELVKLGLPVTLVGRNKKNLREAASGLGLGEQIVAFSGLFEIADGITRERPSVVVNTIGPFTRTARLIAGSCRPGTHYLDVGNEYPQFVDLFSMHEELAGSSRTVVPGAAWAALMLLEAGVRQTDSEQLDAVDF